MSNKDKYNRIKILTLVVLIFSLVLLVLGITYAIYRNFLEGTTSNIINTGTLAFSYNEGDFVTNGVFIDNAYPIPDSAGKNLTGEKEYFDFSVIGQTSTGDINYEVVVVKQDNSTLADKFVKIYLTEINGTIETPSDIVIDDGIVKTFEELENSDTQEGKITYLGTIKNNTMNYKKEFRLRMWMSDTALITDDIFNKEFSVKVAVSAVQ